MLFWLRCCNLHKVGVQSLSKADGKVYVKRRAVRFIDKDIVVFTKDGSFTTKTLFSDENGVYAKAADLKKSDVQMDKMNSGCKGKKGWKNKGNKSGKQRHQGWQKWNKDGKNKEAKAAAGADAPKKQ